MDETKPPPRIFGIPATEADVVAVIRRGPSKWFHLGAWNVLTGEYEPGVWFRGTLYPQRCDLSPDGRLLCYMALRKLDAYIAISKLPWLKALAFWPTPGTWSRGAHFVRDSSIAGLGEPEQGDVSGLRYGLELNANHSFAVERRRGWRETADTPPRKPDDMWDEKRSFITLEKANPHDARLMLRVHKGGIYTLTTHGAETVLDDAQWADWDRHGRLLVATTQGQLRVIDVERNGAVLYEIDLSGMSPDPRPAPEEAGSW